MNNDTEKNFELFFGINTKEPELSSIKINTFIEAEVKITSNRFILFNQTLDLCSLMQKRTTNWQAKVIFGDLSRYPNLPKKCPVKKGFYSATNFTMEMKYIPFKVFVETLLKITMEFYTVIKKKIVILTKFSAQGLMKSNDL